MKPSSPMALVAFGVLLAIPACSPDPGTESSQEAEAAANESTVMPHD